MAAERIRSLVAPVLLVAVVAGLSPQFLDAQRVAASPARIREISRVTIDVDDAPLLTVLHLIATKAGLVPGFQSTVVPSSKRISLHVRDVPATDAFERVLLGTGLRAMVLKTGDVAISRAIDVAAAAGTITGRVVDAKTRQPLRGAVIGLDSTQRAAETSEDGTYRIASVGAGSHVLTVRLLGYARITRTVAVRNEGATVADFLMESSATPLDQVVVTGTVIPTELKAVPNAMTVITAKQIEERGITRIDQLFRGDVPGVFSLNLGSNALLDEVVMFSRGATAFGGGVSLGTANGTNPMKTYVDGIEMVNPKYLSQIDPRSIERIEILTGPQASTIYGSNAINGVMQIFTKRGRSDRPQLSAGVTSGLTQNNFNSRLAPSHVTDMGLTGTEGRIAYNVGATWNYEGAWTPGKQTQRFSVFGAGRTEVGKLITDVSARKGVTRNRQSGLSQQGQTDLRSAGVWTPDATQGLPSSQVATLDGSTYGVSFAHRPRSWWSNELVLGSDASTTESVKIAPWFGTPSDTTLSIARATTTRVSQRYVSTMQLAVASEVKVNVTIGGDHWRTTGSSWNSLSAVLLTGNISNPSVVRHRPDRNSGVYVQGQIGFSDALFATYGVRVDWNPNVGEDVAVKPGRYGISYMRDVGSVTAKIRGSYGRSIRPLAFGLISAHTVADWFGLSATDPFVSQFGNFNLYLANPGLAPEHQSGGEGGVEIYVNSRASLLLTRFNQTVDNLIFHVERVDSVPSLVAVFPSTANCQTNANGTFSFDDTGRCFAYQNQYLNVGSIRNQGWEVHGSLNLGPVTTRGTYSWVKSRVMGVTPSYRALLTGSQFERNRPVDYAPEHTWALGLSYVRSGSTLSLSVNGIGMRYLVGSFATGLSLSASNSRRILVARPRMTLNSSNYRPLAPAYTTADLNATHALSSHVDGVLQIMNLTDYYQNDFRADYALPGRSARAGFRLRL